ncbi:glucosamine 6-phosphate N-acetyltransferase, partial [Thamnocephalis sphaerospora]
MFEASLLGTAVLSRLPDGYHMRPLSADDYDKGYLACLEQLATVGDVSRRQFADQFELMRRQGSSYVVVIEDTRTQRIVASGTLVVEYKFLRGCAHAGHIEDIVVDSQQRGTGLGVRMIEQLKALASTLGCYKLILNCSERNAGFYERCGLRRHDIQMKLY